MSVTENGNYKVIIEGKGDMKPEESFVCHQPCGDRIVFALILDRKKVKERIMAGEASQIFLGINGNIDAELLCDVTRLLGTFLIDFENDMQGDWNRFGIMHPQTSLNKFRWRIQGLICCIRAEEIRKQSV